MEMATLSVASRKRRVSRQRVGRHQGRGSLPASVYRELSFCCLVLLYLMKSKIRLHLNRNVIFSSGELAQAQGLYQRIFQAQGCGVATSQFA
jgi:hypothetical protein